MKVDRLWRGEPLPPAADAGRSTTLSRAVFYMVAFGTLTGFLWAYLQGFYRFKGFPLNTFLFKPEVHMTDLTMFFPLLERNVPYAERAVYPPLNFVLMEPFSWIGNTPATVLWVIVGAGGLAAFLAVEFDFLHIADRLAISIGLVVFSYPFLFAFDRGNVEIFVTLALAAGVYCLQRRNFGFSGALFGAAGALKVYPIIFLALLLIRRKWIASLTGLVAAALLTQVASALYGFTLPRMVETLNSNVSIFNYWFLVGDGGLAFGNSLFGATKILFTNAGDLEQANSLLAVYSWVIPAGFLAAAVAVWLLPLRLWEQVTLLTVALVVLPSSSGDYRLLHFLVPLALFLRLGAGSRLRWWYAVLFALLLVPKAFVLLRPDGTNLGVVLNPLVMLLLAAMVVGTGVARLARKRSGRRAAAPAAEGASAGTVAPQ